MIVESYTDDDRDICETMTIILDLHGYRCEAFQDGHAALARLRSGDPPIVVGEKR